MVGAEWQWGRHSLTQKEWEDILISGKGCWGLR